MMKSYRQCIIGCLVLFVGLCLWGPVQAQTTSKDYEISARDKTDNRDYDGAREDAVSATQANSKDADAWLLLGAIDMIYIEDNYQEALHAFNRYLKLKPHGKHRTQVMDYMVKVRDRLKQAAATTVVRKERGSSSTPSNNYFQPYNPGGAAVVSFYLPGLMQFVGINDEEKDPALGTLLAVSDIGGWVLIGVGVGKAEIYSFDPTTDSYADTGYQYWSSGNEAMFIAGVSLVVASGVGSLIATCKASDDYNQRHSSRASADRGVKLALEPACYTDFYKNPAMGMDLNLKF